MAANFVGTDDFVLLGQKIEELNCEIQRRREAQAALEQSEAELRLAVAALGGLNAISRRLADLRTERDLADAVVRELVAHTGALCAEAYVPADDGRTLHLVAAAGPAAEAIASVGRIPIADVAPAAEAFRSGTAIYLPATAMQERYGRILARGDAIAAVPILLQGRSAGVLTVAFAQSQEFGERERDFLEGVAQTFAGSLRRAQLFESELRSRRATERYADRIQRMLRITAALAQALSPEDVATAVIDDATKAMDASSGELWLVEEQGDSLELARSTGSGPGEKGAFARIALDGSRRLPVVTAVLEREAMFLERDDDLRRWPEIAVPPISVEQHGPLAVVPLIVQGRSVGAISWRYGRVRRIDDDERAMLMMIARYAAQALERARLYESERRARREAEQSEARALDADRRKDEFLAMLGHELRNPLAPILTALQLMRLRGGPAHERERAVIERQVHHLMRLVNDLLDVSRITRGRIQLQAASLDLKAVIARAVEIAAPVLEARAHRLDVRVPDHPLLVHGDAARLSQALSNVLNNAAKYTEPGGDVVVQAFREAGEVVVRVRDSGIGIDSGMLSRIFDLFVQDQRNLDRSQGGLGVGLTIVRSLVELHGGKVSASSDGPGRGSEFEIRLPALEDDAVEALAEPRAPEAPIRTNSEARVLIVDDNVDAASVLADALRDVGYDARIAHDGPAGIEVARTFRPRVVLLDIGLPIVDGYQVAARLRAECAAAPLALVALTGYGQSADRARAKMAGFDEHLVKPVELRSVLEVLERLTSAVPPDGV